MGACWLKRRGVGTPRWWGREPEGGQGRGKDAFVYGAADQPRGSDTTRFMNDQIPQAGSPHRQASPRNALFSGFLNNQGKSKFVDKIKSSQAINKSSGKLEM